ncbi:MAG: ATPase, T2SS/T4P/T4SS family [bacterium]
MAKLGSILLDRKLITDEQLEKALEESERTGESLGKILLHEKMITEAEFLSALGEQLGLPFYINLEDVKISSEIIKAVPAKIVWHYKFIPLELKDSCLTMAVSDPLIAWPAEDIKLQLGYDTKIVLCPAKEIIAAIRRYYGTGAETVEKILKNADSKHKEQNKEVKIEEIGKVNEESASVIKLVDQILNEGISNRATDIHIEPFRNKVRVRQRIDGVLYELKLPDEIKYLHPAIVSRIKIMSGLDVVERRIPQDGRAVVKVKDNIYDLRISIIPGPFAPDIVIRILPTSLLFRLEDLGMSSGNLEKLKALISRPYGILFITGPTGSGKTTTLYACLSHINIMDTKIITIEDPIEYELEGIMQTQVKPEVTFTFASALRCILRHDPDVIMVGEVRDFETAELAIRTALTGHKVFSTIHTNDAASGVTRLLDMGIEPFLLASSVNAFIAQRLVRIICPDCKEKKTTPIPYNNCTENNIFYYGKGCKKCNFLGYRGRTSLHEVLIVDDEIKELVVKKAAASEVKKVAQQKGMVTLWEHGWQMVKEGITTPEEVLKVTQLGG